MNSVCCDAKVVIDYTSADSVCTECGNVIDSMVLQAEVHSEDFRTVETDGIEHFLESLISNLPDGNMSLMNDCMQKFYDLSESLQKKQSIVVIYHMVSSYDLKILAEISGYSYSKLSKRLKMLSSTFSTTLKSYERELLKTAYHFGLDFKVAKHAFPLTSKAFDHVNRSPQTIICGIFLFKFRIDTSEYHKVSKSTIRKVIMELKDLE